MSHLWHELLEEGNGRDASLVKTHRRPPVMPGAAEVALVLVEEDDAEAEVEAEVEVEVAVTPHLCR